MNAGVCTAPCGVVNTPRLAAPSVCVTEKVNEDMAGCGLLAADCGPEAGSREPEASYISSEP